MAELVPCTDQWPQHDYLVMMMAVFGSFPPKTCGHLCYRPRRECCLCNRATDKCGECESRDVFSSRNRSSGSQTSRWVRLSTPQQATITPAATRMATRHYARGSIVNETGDSRPTDAYKAEYEDALVKKKVIPHTLEFAVICCTIGATYCPRDLECILSISCRTKLRIWEWYKLLCVAFAWTNPPWWRAYRAVIYACVRKMRRLPWFGATTNAPFVDQRRTVWCEYMCDAVTFS